MTKIISISSIEGAGKTFLLKALKQRLEANGFTALHLAELSSTQVGQDIAEIVRERTLDATTEALLFQVARWEQYWRFIENAEVDFILLDRYIDDTYIYQRRIGKAKYFSVNLSLETGINPDLTFILDVPDADVDKVIARSKVDKFSDLDHHEINKEFKALNQDRHVHLQYNDSLLVDKVYDMIMGL